MSLEYEVMVAMHELIDKWELMYYTGLRRGRKKTLKDFSIIEIHVIRLIGRQGGTCPMLTIREILQVPNSTLTSLVKRLEQNGVLVREKDAEDNRAYILTLTEFGKKIDEEHVRMDMGVAENFVKRVRNQEDIDGFIHAIADATRTRLVSDEFAVRK